MVGRVVEIPADLCRIPLITQLLEWRTDDAALNLFPTLSPTMHLLGPQNKVSIHLQYHSLKKRSKRILRKLICEEYNYLLSLIEDLQLSGSWMGIIRMVTVT